ncbi:hypothetical protein ACWC6I_39125 [Streptomyces sp. NPDC001414]
MATPADGTTHLSPDGPERRLRAEIERLRDEATRQRALAHRRSEFWTKMDIALGFPAALLAGTAGTAGLASADARVPAALAALTSAGFAAGAGFLRSDTRRRANKRGLLHGRVTAGVYAASAAGGVMMVSYSTGVNRPRRF